MPSRNREGQAALNPHVVNRIVEAGLCLRCGACDPACPVEIIGFDSSHWPVITDEPTCIRSCTRCLEVCPGGEVDFGALDERILGRHPHPESITGVARRVVVAHAADEAIRRAGTSGGFVTQILAFLLGKGRIDGALVLGSTAGDGGWRETPLIARSAEEVRGAAKSKYLIVPHLRPLREIEDNDGRYAVVGLPCHIHALRKYQMVSPKVRDRVVLVIGLFCNVALEPRAGAELFEANGLAASEVRQVDFRHGRWPGGVHALLRDGRVVKLLRLEEMKEEFNLLKLFQTPERCRLCIDFTSEYADLAVGDPWLRGPDGAYLFPDGGSCVLVRTEAGETALSEALGAGALGAQEIPLRTFMVNFERSAGYKKTLIPDFIRLQKRFGAAVPEYHRGLGGRGGLLQALPPLRMKIVEVLARRRLVRRLGLRLGQTAPVIAYLRWNRARKAARFAAAHRASETDVERFLAPRAS